jgi:hypothetical protein
VSLSFTGFHCVLSVVRTSTFPSTAIALAIGGSHDAADERLGDSKLIMTAAQIISRADDTTIVLTRSIIHLPLSMRTHPHAVNSKASY